MISSLRVQLSDVNADNIFDVIIALRVYKLSCDSLLMYSKRFESLEAQFALLALANLRLELETNFIADFAIKDVVWPPNMADRLEFIQSDLNKSEEALQKIVDILRFASDRQSHMLKALIERTLS